jgi:hypothetical protein
MTNFDWVPLELSGRFSYVNKKLVSSCEICGVFKVTRGKGYVIKRISEGHSSQYRFCTAHGQINSGPRQRSDVETWPVGSKRCTKCLEIKPFEDFHKHRTAMFGYNTICKLCREVISAEHYLSQSFELTLYQSAKGRAGRNGREFSISIEDIVIPAVCPVLCVPIERVRGSWYAPSIDRIDPDGGYTKDNILVMSKRANTLKNNMTYDEAMKLAFFLRQWT